MEGLIGWYIVVFVELVDVMGDAGVNWMVRIVLLLG